MIALVNIRESLQEYHKAQSWDPSFSIFLSMIYFLLLTNQPYVTTLMTIHFKLRVMMQTLSLISCSRATVYLKCHFVFLINCNTKLEIKFWFLFLYWNWDIKHKTYKSNWFSDFQNNRTLKFKIEVRFLFFVLIWKTKNQIYLKLVEIYLKPYWSHYEITLHNYNK